MTGPKGARRSRYFYACRIHAHAKHGIEHRRHFARDLYSAAGCRINIRQHAQKRAFSRAVVTDQGNPVTIVGFETDVCKRVYDQVRAGALETTSDRFTQDRLS